MTAGPDPADLDDGELDAQSLFSLFSRAHTLDVVYVFVVDSDPPLRFNDLEASLDVPPNTLSRRLDELETVGFLERESYDEIPPRVEYEPTEKLWALEPMFVELAEWMAEYGAEELELPD